MSQMVVWSADVKDEMVVTRKQLMQGAHTALSTPNPPSFGDMSCNSRTPNMVCGSMVMICTHFTIQQK
jgi:hypothetical protein